MNTYAITFPKNRVVHQLEEIFLKGVFSHFSLFGGEVSVRLQLWSLIEFNYSVDIFQHHTKFLVELQSSIVDDIFVLIM